LAHDVHNDRAGEIFFDADLVSPTMLQAKSMTVGTSGWRSCPPGMDTITRVAVVALALGACSHGAAPRPPAVRPAAKGAPPSSPPVADTGTPPLTIAGRHGVVAEAALHRALLERFGAPFTPPCAEMDLPRVAYGDDPRVQQQDVPLSFWGQNPPEPTASPPPSPPPPEGTPNGAAARAQWARSILDAAARYERGRAA